MKKATCVTIAWRRYERNIFIEEEAQHKRPNGLAAWKAGHLGEIDCESKQRYICERPLENNTAEGIVILYFNSLDKFHLSMYRGIQYISSNASTEI